MFALLKTFSWQELRQHPWRNAAAVLAVMLGVALAFSVHLINASALDEFAQAARTVGGQGDLVVRAVQGQFDEALYQRLARHPKVALASPVLEVGSYLQTDAGKRSVRVLGVDALLLPGITPDLLPIPDLQPISAAAGVAGQASQAHSADMAYAFGPPLGARASRPHQNEGGTPALPGGGSTLHQHPSRPAENELAGSIANEVADVAPAPAQAERGARFVLFAPGQVFLNPAARRLADAAPDQTPPANRSEQPDRLDRPAALQLQSGMRWLPVRVAGSVRASGPALLVMDLGAAQELFGKQGQLSRIDLRLQPGVAREALAAELLALPGWPANVSVATADDAQSQIGNLSRAYRVNLTVLALIALFTGAFLVFSVLSLSVAKRAQQFALLGVLGLSARSRLALVLWESLALGAVGSLGGLALGSGLAALALRLLGGDLGGGFFQGAAPALQWSSPAALVYGGLGVAAALVGGWWPARAVQQLPPAQTLKGLGHLGSASQGHWISLALIAASAMLATLPALFGIPLAAYVAIALLLVGGITALPWLIGLLLGLLAPLVARQTLGLLAVERARRQRNTAAVAVSGVVASLSLAVALTVMVASFRESVTQWLDQMLPADLYVRSAANLGASDTVFFSPELVAAAARLDGVKRLQTQRTLALLLQNQQPAVALLARELADPARSLPLLADPLPVPPGQIGIFVSEAVVDLHAAQVGRSFPLLSKAFGPLAQAGQALPATFFVAGVWRDYARQSGAIAIARADFEALTGDTRSNDLALWLDDTAQAGRVQQQLRALALTLASAPPATATATLLRRDKLAEADPASTPPASATRLRHDELAAANPASTPPATATPLRRDELAEAGPTGSARQTGPDTRPATDDLLEFGTSAQIRAVSLLMFDRSFAVTYWLQAVAIGIGLFGVAASFSAQVLSRRKEFGLLTHLGLTRRQILAVVALEGAAWTALGALAGLGLGLLVSVLLVHVVNPQSFHWTMSLLLPWPRLLLLCLAVVLAGTLTAWLAARAAASQDAVLAVKQDW